MKLTRNTWIYTNQMRKINIMEGCKQESEKQEEKGDAHEKEPEDMSTWKDWMTDEINGRNENIQSHRPE